jgi:hypothetical protein
MTFTVVYEVGQEALARIMRDRPSLADEISLTLSRQATAGQAGVAEDAANRTASLSELVSRIRQLFAVPHS